MCLCPRAVIGRGALDVNLGQAFLGAAPSHALLVFPWMVNVLDEGKGVHIMIPKTMFTASPKNLRHRERKSYREERNNRARRFARLRRRLYHI